MKKLLIRLACFILALAMAMSFAACGRDKIKDGTDGVQTTETPVEEPKQPTPAELVKKYVEDNADAVKTTLSNDTVTVELKAVDTTVVYVFKLLNVPEATDKVKESIKQGYEAIAEQMKTSLDDMKKEQPAVTAITIKYCAANGDELFTDTIK